MDNTLALRLGAILNNKLTNKKHKNEKNMTLHRPWRGPLFIAVRAESRQSNTSLIPAGLLKIFTTMRMSANNYESAIVLILGYFIDFGDTNKF